MRITPVVLVLVVAIGITVFRDEIAKKADVAWLLILLQSELGLTQDMINKDKKIYSWRDRARWSAQWFHRNTFET